MRKLLGFLMTFFMISAILAGTVYAAPTVPGSTSVTIHKIVSTSQLTLKDHDGHKLTDLEIKNLWPGLNAVENNTGVEFTVWQVKAGDTTDKFTNMSVDQLNAAYPGPVTVSAGTPYSFKTGTYYVVETKRPATLESSIGVPFIMELPVLNTDNTAYLTELHLYPKNVIEDDMPAIDKDVETKNQDHAGYDIGYTFDYLIYPKVPKGIQDYTEFKVSDTLASPLDYMGNIDITYNGVTFIKDTDYTVTESPAGTAGGSFTVIFTAAGLKKLADNRPESETLKDLEIRFQARINKTASMGTDIYNNAVLTFNNGYFTTDQTREVPEINRPEVHTGGRQFIKIDNVTQTYLEALKTATFYVKNNDGKYMKKDADGKVTWVAKTENPTLITVDAVNGTFEVTGLAYGDKDEAFTYWLEEKDVPEGYVKMDDLTFTIDKASYGDPISITDNTKVINVKKPHIPQTGGIGTIIFLAAGLSLMGAAVIALKKKENPEK